MSSLTLRQKWIWLLLMSVVLCPYMTLRKTTKEPSLHKKHIYMHNFSKIWKHPVWISATGTVWQNQILQNDSCPQQQKNCVTSKDTKTLSLEVSNFINKQSSMHLGQSKNAFYLQLMVPVSSVKWVSPLHNVSSGFIWRGELTRNRHSFGGWTELLVTHPHKKNILQNVPALDFVGPWTFMFHKRPIANCYTDCTVW